MDDDERDEELEELEEEEDPGFVGGGGPASTLPDYKGPEDEEGHLADTDHEEF